MEEVPRTVDMNTSATGKVHKPHKPQCKLVTNTLVLSLYIILMISMTQSSYTSTTLNTDGNEDS